MPHLHPTILEPCPICELGAAGPCPACNGRGPHHLLPHREGLGRGGVGAPGAACGADDAHAGAAVMGFGPVHRGLLVGVDGTIIHEYDFLNQASTVRVARHTRRSHAAPAPDDPGAVPHL